MLAVRGHGPRALPGTCHVAIPGQRPAPLGGICVADLRHVLADFLFTGGGAMAPCVVLAWRRAGWRRIGVR